MPSTPNGTAYATAMKGSSTGFGAAMYGVADTHANDVAIPTVLYCHGNGSGYNSFDSNPAWNGLKYWLMDNGWAWVDSRGGGPSSWGKGGSDQWGGGTAREDYEQSIAWASESLDIGPIVVLGRSMGGLPAYWLATESPVIAPKAAGLIINSGVTDLAYRLATSTGTDRTNLLAAYQAADDAEFATKSAAFDPMLGDMSVYDGVNILQMYGTSDWTVPWAQNGAAIRDLWAGRPALDLVDVREGGDHSNSNGSYLQVDAMTSFLEQVTGDGGTPINPITFYRIHERYLRLAGKVHQIPL